jgi:hypothetical protein
LYHKVLLMVLMPSYAPIVVLLFLGSILAGMLAAAVLIYGIARNHARVRLGAAIALLAIPAGYATLLFGASLTSQERVLPHGAKKYFCEIDCHLAYSVERVVTSKTLGNHARPVRAAGTFYVISLKTWFDESTISPMRPKDAPLYPNPRQVYIVDATGRRFELSPAGARALGDAGVPSTPLSRPLVPGESYLTELVFDLPEDVSGARLFVGNADPESSFLIGHELSPFHRKIWFGL